MNDKNSEIISKIIELETQITSEIIKGYKPFTGDHLESKRIELKTLRCILFGFDSNFCKK